MSKPNPDHVNQVAIGWFQPHAPVNWTGEILDLKTGELVKEPSMTKQSFKDECDINNIVRDFTKTGLVQHINERAAQFVDLPDQVDFQMGLELVRQAQGAFDALPAQIRARFQNDPAQFLAFCEDPANGDELVELGLANARPKPPPAAPEPPVKPEAKETAQ